MTFPDPLDALIPKNCNSIFCRSLRPGQPRGPRVTLSGILRGPSIEPFLAEEGSLVRAPPVQSPSTAHTVECLTNMRGRIWSPWKTSPPEMSPWGSPTGLRPSLPYPSPAISDPCQAHTRWVRQCVDLPGMARSWVPDPLPSRMTMQHVTHDHDHGYRTHPLPPSLNDVPCLETKVPWLPTDQDP